MGKIGEFTKIPHMPKIAKIGHFGEIPKKGGF